MASKKRPAAPAGPPENPELENLYDQADAAFERGDFERALSLSRRALALAPRSAEALHYCAAALARLERFEEAAQTYRTALEADPEDLETLRGAVEFLLYDLADDRDMAEDALKLLKRGLKQARKRDDVDHLVDLLLLEGIALGNLAEPLRALEPLEEAARLSPEDPEVLFELGAALLEALRFGEARKRLEKAVSLDRRHAHAVHYLGLLAEREGDLAAAERHFKEARRLSPEDFPKPVELAPEAFDRAVEAALEDLPARVRDYLANVNILVEDLPDLDDLKASHPPLSPLIVGLFRGTPYPEQSTSDPWSWFPTAILLFQRNLQRSVRTREELIEQIGITLIHEVGHFLGLSEEDLYQRGLD